MTVIRIDPGRVHDKTTWTSAFPVELDLLRLAKIGKVPGAKLRDLSPLYPKSLFRDYVLGYAKFWVAHFAQRGMDLLTPEDEIVVSGPWRPMDRALMLQSAPEARGYSDPMDAVRALGTVDFRFTADFITHQRAYADAPAHVSGNPARVALRLWEERERKASLV